ncbi:hybrid sensor histidine kinase/response regulator [Syntrophus gentianae]|nr:PAS domain S-box protein [Syntrophus gentianae]
MSDSNQLYQELIEENTRLKKRIQEFEEQGNPTENRKETFLENEALFRFIVENSLDIISIFDLNLQLSYVSPAVSHILGFTVEEAMEQTLDPIFPPESLERIRSAFAEEMQQEASGKADPTRVRILEVEAYKTDGSRLWMEIRFSFLRNREGKALGILAVSQDISHRYQVEQALRESEAYLRTIFDNTHDAIFIHDVEGNILDCNQRRLELYGITRDQALSGSIVKDFSAPDNPFEKLPGLWKRALEGEPVSFEWKAKRPKDGSTFDMEVSLKRIVLGGRPVILSNARDISAHKAWEAALRESEEKFRALVENCGDGILRIDRNHRYLYANSVVTEHTGIPAGNFIGKTIHELGLPEEIGSPWYNAVEQAFCSGEIQRLIFQFPSGRWFESIHIPERDDTGQVKAVIASVRDITEHKKNEVMLARLFQAAPLVICATNSRRIITKVNDFAFKTFGYTPEEMLGRDPAFLYFNDQDYQDAAEALYTPDNPTRELRMKRKNGQAIWALISRSHLNGMDTSDGSIVVVQDITTRKALEEQLRQAQKMEAIGQLAGGVAHDFNNMLQAILGYTNIVLHMLEPDDKRYKKLMEVEKAGEKAAQLTRQLLAFSRRQVLKLGPLDLNQIIDDLLKMLRRLIGENIDLNLVTDKALWTVNADRGQMEQVLLNLCVNARDAMPDGGWLSIETANVSFDEDYCVRHDWAKPGDYVLLSITDSGCGMDEETKQRIFEPFFTTKDQGRGTGLGLATVYGIVRQHEGMVYVYSEVGKGTRFNVYLPAIEKPADEIPAEAPEPVSGGPETILLAEDDEPLRFLTEEILKSAGYRVLTAVDGEDALRVYREHGQEIDLLLLDVVMPRKGGHEACDEIRTIRPGIPCIFMSGYSEDAISKNFVVEQEFRLIQKPFKSLDLLRTLRQELDHPQREGVRE